jgi:hypothetical protein
MYQVREKYENDKSSTYTVKRKTNSKKVKKENYIINAILFVGRKIVI